MNAWERVVAKGLDELEGSVAGSAAEKEAVRAAFAQLAWASTANRSMEEPR